MCGGTDRFRFDDKDGRGTWFCNNCRAGDGISLVMRFANLKFPAAARLIEQHIGASPVSNGRRERTDGQKAVEMKSLWARAQPITLADHAGQYLHARTGLETFPAALRYSADERYFDHGAKPIWLPAMVARVDPCDRAVAAGERASLHRTYLSPYASKAEVSSPRKMMGSMPPGAAVRLMRHGDTLGIAEGIETAISATALFGCPCWAALAAGLMELCEPPPTVTTVIIFGDNDASLTGQAAAYTLAKRLQSKGISATAEIPSRTGDDWNVVL